MFAWGSVISDTWLNKNSSVTERQNILINIPEDSTRNFPFPSSKPVVIEDNVWIGFDAVILPGVRLGRGCVVGCKTIVDTDVPPYAVITGSPARIVKYLNPNDTEEAKEEAMKQCIK
jgi:acetyltransferase-like isoleucine patch superfamily enzyme